MIEKSKRRDTEKIVKKNRNIGISFVIIITLTLGYYVTDQFASNNKTSEKHANKLNLRKVREINQLVPLNLKPSPLHGDFAKVTEPTKLIYLLYIGVGLLAVCLLVLGISLIRSK